MKRNVPVIISKFGLLEKSEEELASMRSSSDEQGWLTEEQTSVYIRSLRMVDGVLYCMSRNDDGKSICAASRREFTTPFDAPVERLESMYFQTSTLSKKNAHALFELFPFTKPVSLRNERTTIGMGDRIGRATAGQLRAARKYNVYPVLAQQSVRELQFTGRTFADVVTDAAFLVFQEGFERGYGADGDHLKTIEAIDTALAEHMPMITLDLTEVMKPEVAEWSDKEVAKAYEKLKTEFRKRVESEYAGKEFKYEAGTVTISVEEARRCAVMYGPALDFSEEVDAHLRQKTDDSYDLEISIDETTTPTLPSHHLFIARELNARGVTVNSLAPRFIGEFQKAIDYIGDVAEFEKQFALHCEIAKSNGYYKISVHSGSDKFLVYPVVGKYTSKRLHLKTAGTSWLESLRTVACAEPDLYRRMHTKAYEYYPTALKQYHITANLDKIAPLDEVENADLSAYLDDPNCRQLLHISYGGLLNDPEIRDDYFAAIHKHEEFFARILAGHFDKHISLLGIERLES